MEVREGFGWLLCVTHRLLFVTHQAPLPDVGGYAVCVPVLRCGQTGVWVDWVDSVLSVSMCGDGRRRRMKKTFIFFVRHS